MLAVGLFAILLHLLAGAGGPLAGTHGNQGFHPDVCGSQGISGPGTMGDLPHDSHDCCELCAAGAPLVLPAAKIAVAPAPTLAALPARPLSAVPTIAETSSHPPRGPPRSA